MRSMSFCSVRRSSIRSTAVFHSKVFSFKKSLRTSGYCVFTVRHRIGNPEELNRCLAYLKQEPTAEFISDEKEMIIEKGKGVSSFLVQDCFHNAEPGEWSFPMHDFVRYGYQKDVRMKETICVFGEGIPRYLCGR